MHLSSFFTRSLHCAIVLLPLAGWGQDARPNRAAILKQLDQIRSAERGLSIMPSEGEYLSKLATRLNAKRVLEIGTASGYSGVWLGLALRETGGRLITLEIDPQRHSRAVRNFKEAGLDDIIDARLTDALQEIPKLEGPFDLVFIDAWKPDYAKYLAMTLPMVRSGGIIIAHNVRNQQREMPEFLEAIRNNPALRTEFVEVTRSGFSVSTKK
jgi:predicted O-methyltransferase YrrM